MNPFLDYVQAFAKVTGATGASTTGRGCTSSRTGVGDYAIALDRPLDESASVCKAMARALGATAYVVHTSDTVKQVLTRSMAVPAPADANFIFIARKIM